MFERAIGVIMPGVNCDSIESCWCGPHIVHLDASLGGIALTAQKRREGKAFSTVLSSRNRADTISSSAELAKIAVSGMATQVPASSARF
jgi:hypothetical protein